MFLGVGNMDLIKQRSASPPVSQRGKLARPDNLNRDNEVKIGNSSCIEAHYLIVRHRSYRSDEHFVENSR